MARCTQNRPRSEVDCLLGSSLSWANLSVGSKDMISNARPGQFRHGAGPLSLRSSHYNLASLGSQASLAGSRASLASLGQTTLGVSQTDAEHEANRGAPPQIGLRRQNSAASFRRQHSDSMSPSTRRRNFTVVLPKTLCRVDSTRRGSYQPPPSPLEMSKNPSLSSFSALTSSSIGGLSLKDDSPGLVIPRSKKGSSFISMRRKQQPKARKTPNKTPQSSSMLSALESAVTRSLIRIRESVERLTGAQDLNYRARDLLEFILDRCPEAAVKQSKSKSKSIVGKDSKAAHAELFAACTPFAPDRSCKLNVPDIIFKRCRVLDYFLERHPQTSGRVIDAMRALVEGQPEDIAEVEKRVIRAIVALRQDDIDKLGPSFWRAFSIICLAAAEMQIYNLSPDSIASHLAHDLVRNHHRYLLFYMPHEVMKKGVSGHPLIEDDEWRKSLRSLDPGFATDFVCNMALITPRMLKVSQSESPDDHVQQDVKKRGIIKNPAKFNALYSCFAILEQKAARSIHAAVKAINSLCADFPLPERPPDVEGRIQARLDKDILLMACMNQITSLPESVVWLAGTDVIGDLIAYAIESCGIDIDGTATPLEPAAIEDTEDGSGSLEPAAFEGPEDLLGCLETVTVQDTEELAGSIGAGGHGRQ